MSIQNVAYGPVYGKAEDVETGAVNTFKVFDGFPAEISENGAGVTVIILLENGKELKGKSELTGRVGLKIAYTKALRKFLKAKLHEEEPEADGSLFSKIFSNGLHPVD